MNNDNLTSDPLLQLYYQNFHHAHPILIPLSALCGPLAQYIPAQVLTVMRYIGAHYHWDSSVRDTFRESALSGLSLSTTRRDGFQVQSMLLLAISVHAHGGHDDMDRAMEIIEQTISLALDLGMQDASFAVANGQGQPAIEEMWRRTYWELYVVDALLSALRQRNSLLYHTPSDVRLPCDETLYNAESSIPQGYLLADLAENWPRGPQHCHFSSFAYRVDAVRLLGSVLALKSNSSSITTSDDEAAAIDDALFEWQRHFPHRQEDLSTGTPFDELIFQAQMIVHSAVIYLYRPRSSLSLPTLIDRNSITNRFFPSNQSARSSAPSSSKITLDDPNTTKLVRAADSLSNLLTLPSPVKRHSPFLIHGLAMGVFVHTAAYARNMSMETARRDDESSFKVRIELAVGVLNKLAETWPLASVVKKEVVRVYRDAVGR
ncbi:hypothetical protein BGW36DRAFT_444578 [Talaromyces proteolyticus]|uniref:Xylanolytic transcriptional activator regulatory domain-containing protein n=1 Tax=Talaromyces proteolyticus TaxID=1131652 RepID=A0AAD4Q0F4_9EURO|nr:uncharacterized protein BGW36DRAFT_444578 [Talaromyces proteolyticus]KAH8704028.1 hypothetical protein BGW36DRAFT_444578 [Talaromyces proteolyticus]